MYLEHFNINTTAVYLRFNDQELQEIYERVVARSVLALVFPNFKRVLHLNLALLYFANIAFFVNRNAL